MERLQILVKSEKEQRIGDTRSPSPARDVGRAEVPEAPEGDSRGGLRGGDETDPLEVAQQRVRQAQHELKMIQERKRRRSEADAHDAAVADGEREAAEALDMLP